jgi:hypothetical protein
MRQLKIIATLVGGLLAAVVLGYLALLFINRHDQPPSQDALHFAELYRDRPPVANADNGYLYAIDFPESGDLFDRYRGLLSHSGWRQPKPFEATARWPTHGKIPQGQELLLLRAAELADGGDIAGVHDLLAEDVRFWRMVLGSSDLLIDKMSAVVMLDRHFELANLALRRLSAKRVADVEGARRAAVLATTLRSSGVSAEDVPAQLAASEIRDPYTNGPFAWDLKEKAIVFTGLVPGERGRHDLKY